MAAVNSRQRRDEFARAWGLICEDYGIPHGVESKAAEDALFGFGLLCQSRGKRSVDCAGRRLTYESSPPGATPDEYVRALASLKAICVRDSSGATSSGLVVRFEERQRTEPVTAVGGQRVETPPPRGVWQDIKPDTLGDEPLCVLARKRDTRGRFAKGASRTHLMAKLSEARTYAEEQE